MNKKDIINFRQQGCLETILKRRSIRNFKEKDVPEDLVEIILETGRQAPSAGNRQPCRFIVVRERDTINKITDTTYPGTARDSDKHQDWIRTAPLLIVICTDNRNTVARYGQMGKKASLLDTGAVVENMLLAVVSLSLASCWIGGFRESELKQVLEIPDDIKVTSFLPIGYSDENPEPRGRKDMNELLFYEKYGQKQ